MAKTEQIELERCRDTVLGVNRFGASAPASVLLRAHRLLASNAAR